MIISRGRILTDHTYTTYSNISVTENYFLVDSLDDCIQGLDTNISHLHHLQ